MHWRAKALVLNSELSTGTILIVGRSMPLTLVRVDAWPAVLAGAAQHVVMRRTSSDTFDELNK